MSTYTCIDCGAVGEQLPRGRRKRCDVCRDLRKKEKEAAWRAARGDAIRDYRRVMPCQTCGKEFDRGEHAHRRKNCDACRKTRNVELSRLAFERRVERLEQERRAQEKPRKTKVPPKSLVEVARLAHKAGMTYGQYVAHGLQEGAQAARGVDG